MKWDGTYKVHTEVEVNGILYRVGDIVKGEKGKELYRLGKAWVNVQGKVYNPVREGPHNQGGK